MKLFVLAEKVGVAISSTGEPPTELVELFTIRRGWSNPTESIALFLSPLDAAICMQHLNRKTSAGRQNRYEIRSHRDPAVIRTVNSARCDLGIGISLVPGFSTDSTGNLVVRGDAYSLTYMPLLNNDIQWLFGGCPRPNPDVVTAAYSAFAKFRAPFHKYEITLLSLMSSTAIQGLARIAVRKIAIRAQAHDECLSVYSCLSQSWRQLA